MKKRAALWAALRTMPLRRLPGADGGIPTGFSSRLLENRIEVFDVVIADLADDIGDFPVGGHQQLTCRRYPLILYVAGKFLIRVFTEQTG